MSRSVRPVAALLLTVPVVLAVQAGAQVKRVTRPLLRPNPYRGVRFFPSLKWQLTLGMPAHTVPALADLDLDGAMDLVVPAADGKLYRLSEGGQVIWKADLPEPVTAGVTLGDVDRNGTLDILLACGKTLLCLAPDGTERWRQDLTEPIQSFPTVADLDGDGSPEVLVGANDNHVRALDGQGKEKWSFETKSWITGGFAVADLDGDRKLEVVFGSMDFNVYCLDAAGKERWHFATENWVQSAPCIGDLDRDGGLDVVVAGDDGSLYCLSRSGALKWKSPLGGQQRSRTYLALADLDGEGTLESITALPNGQVFVHTAIGDLAWSRGTPGGVTGSPLIADLNGDGWQDLLLASHSGYLTALDTWGGTHWQHSVGHRLEATPLLADLDRNGKYEAYVASRIGDGENGFFNKLEMSVAGGRGLWMTLKGDPYRTGAVSNGLDFSAALKKGGDYATAWEPFGASSRPRSAVQPPRKLKITTLPLDDRWGNRDGALDPGETALWKVQVTNEGRGPSYDSLLTVDLGKSPLVLDRKQMYLGWVAPRATKTVTFRLTAPKLAPKQSLRDVALASLATLQVRETGVQAALARAQLLKVPPLPAVLKSAKRRVVDASGTATSGNGNGRLDAGETALLRMVIQNSSLTTAPRATVRLLSGSTDLLVATPEVRLGALVPFGGRQVEFALRVAKQVTAPSVLLRLVTEVPGSPTQTEEIRLTLGKGSVDATPPLISVTSPTAALSVTRSARAVVAGTVSDPAGIAGFRFNQKPLPLAELTAVGRGRYRFSVLVELKVGENVFPLMASDAAGNTVTKWVRIVRKP